MATPVVGQTTTISIRRTISTAPYESVSVELTETYAFTSREQRSAAYKSLSGTVESIANYERKKYETTKRRKAREQEER